MLSIVGKNPAVDQKSWPTVILIGSSFHFSDQLLRMLRIGVEGVRFERLDGPHQLADWERTPRVVIVHEAIDDLEECVASLRRDQSGALIAIGCSNPAIVRQFRTWENAPPVSALQMNVQVDVWFSILRLLLSGHPYVPVGIGSPGAAKPTAAASMKNDPVPNESLPDAIGPAKLTPREMEILPLIARGEQNKTIASKLGLSVHTVKLHSHNIFSKLGVSNRTGAANWYLSQMMEDGHVRARSRSDQNQ